MAIDRLHHHYGGVWYVNETGEQTRRFHKKYNHGKVQMFAGEDDVVIGDGWIR